MYQFPSFALQPGFMGASAAFLIVMLPSCVVTLFANLFPPPGGNFSLFTLWPLWPLGCSEQTFQRPGGVEEDKVKPPCCHHLSLFLEEGLGQSLKGHQVCLMWDIAFKPLLLSNFQENIKTLFLVCFFLQCKIYSWQVEPTILTAAFFLSFLFYKDNKEPDCFSVQGFTHCS